MEINYIKLHEKKVTLEKRRNVRIVLEGSKFTKLNWTAGSGGN